MHLLIRKFQYLNCSVVIEPVISLSKTANASRIWSICSCPISVVVEPDNDVVIDRTSSSCDTFNIEDDVSDCDAIIKLSILSIQLARVFLLNKNVSYSTTLNIEILKEIIFYVLWDRRIFWSKKNIFRCINLSRKSTNLICSTHLMYRESLKVQLKRNSKSIITRVLKRTDKLVSWLFISKLSWINIHGLSWSTQAISCSMSCRTFWNIYSCFYR